MLFSKLLILKLLVLWLPGKEIANSTTAGSDHILLNCDRLAKEELDLHSAVGLFFFRNRPYTGQVYSTYPTGQLAEEKTLLEGQVHGVSRKWFEDGTLSFEGEYVRGLRHGKTTSWWRNGQKRSISQFVDGIPHGEQWQWYQNGRKFKRIQLENGKQEGLQQSWRANGKLYNNYEAKNGRIFGLKRANLCYELSDENIQSNN